MLLGRHLYRRRTEEDMANAVECYEQALEIDADNAQCWLGLALVQVSRTGLGHFESYDEGFRAARTAIETALRIEPDLAAAQVLLAGLKLLQDRDFRGADESIQRARELRVDDIDLIEMGSMPLRILGQFDEVIGTGQKVLAVDPLNIAALSSISSAGYPAGKLDEAERAARLVLEIAPHAVHRRSMLALILAENGRFDEARIEAAKETDPVSGPWATALVEIAAGRPDKARGEVDSLIREYREEAAFQIAEVYSKMGESDKAFEFLYIAVDTDPGITEILGCPQLRALHTDPRWEPLLRKIGIPEEYWPKT
jgi:tetratricopeptide (TPR) repeat protein